MVTDSTKIKISKLLSFELCVMHVVQKKNKIMCNACGAEKKIK